ncbi:RNA-binding protein S1 [Tuanshanicoccus lijuaniae]|uniref:S1 domain-containing RNA-binding protein n=1 Tax=Aerococcaceae bacterium zg-1292 TaxID=2774330 RepID=UPI001936BCE4|nr:RNA-binding protein S1 [Aerococcaceae bacterium zg-1292]MBF6626046.1 RNA-binding protein S1 [Aerococcaceae bacterium zg-BR9]MBF6978866.1 RNA-binding protein S1 [Aerococcaceae bacterium zg-BR22]MBS4455300.1 RNA-binding protein S1 [Aerococcaceae bacterium zg-A91]MBS4457890.1 RNA-binding protein S1 [Aerococcaceae bacterium zg-BR33]
MSIEVGQKLSGKVTGITHFGAFVELPEKQSGLVHISEVSDGFIKDINTVLTVGQEVEVKVLSVAADGKISLSIRQALDKPVESRPSRPQTKRPFDKKDKGEQEPRFTKRNEFNKTSNRPSNANFGQATSSARSNSDFDQLMSNFLKDSEDRLTSLKRNTEGKRGGRGGRRS